VRVPKEYLETRDGSRTLTFSEAFGLDVQTPPCLTQKEQLQARAGISEGSGSQASSNVMLAQWQLP
jgi:hypothetical protein